jgi:hypothetical protein
MAREWNALFRKREIALSLARPRTTQARYREANQILASPCRYMHASPKVSEQPTSAPPRCRSIRVQSGASRSGKGLSAARQVNWSNSVFARLTCDEAKPSVTRSYIGASNSRASSTLLWPCMNAARLVAVHISQ